MKIRMLAAAPALLALVGCAGTHLRAPLPDYAGSGAATLYVQRPPGALGGMQEIHISIDGTDTGTIGPGQYWRIRMRPGVHDVAIRTGGLQVRLAPHGVRCVTVGTWEATWGFSIGYYIRPSEHCPPPKGWKLTAASGG